MVLVDLSTCKLLGHGLIDKSFNMRRSGHFVHSGAVLWISVHHPVQLKDLRSLYKHYLILFVCFYQYSLCCDLVQKICQHN